MSGEKRDREAEIPTLYSYWRSSASWRIRMAVAWKSGGHQTIEGHPQNNASGNDIVYKYHAINLLKKEESSPEFLKVNPAGLVPAMVFPGATPLVLSQSMAILEYLEECYGPAQGYPSLFPPTSGKTPAQVAEERAVVRSMALHIVSGVHPVQNLGVLVRVSNTVKSNIAKTNASNADVIEDQSVRQEWAKETIQAGLDEFEVMLRNAMSPEKRALFNNWTDLAAITAYVEGKGDQSHRFYCFGDSLTMADCCLVPQLYNATRFNVPLLRKEGAPSSDPHTPIIACIQASLNHHEKAVMTAAHPDSMPDAAK